MNPIRPAVAAPRRCAAVAKAATAAAALLAGAALLAPTATAQPTTDAPLAPPANGMRAADVTRHAITGATVHTAPGRTLDNATVVFDDGVIVAVGRAVDTAGARVHDASGMHVYAAFIDAFVEVDAPMPDDALPGRHWNDRVTPRRSALAGGGLTDADAERLRSLGFGAAAVSPKDGVFRGAGALVSTASPFDAPSQGEVPVYADGVFSTVAFDRVSWPQRGHPSSIMGSISLIRQTLLDADWQRATGADAPNALTPLEDPGALLVFDADHELEALLADRVATEFERPIAVYGSGTEYQRLDAIAAAARPVIVPLRFPTKPEVSSVGAADAVDLETLMAWEQAPTNPRRLARAGLTVAISASDLPKGADFHANLRRAADEGSLSADDALAMLTTNPAQILGVSDRMGTIEPGKVASLIVSTGPILDEDTELRAIWVDGRRHRLERDDAHGLDGEWSLWVGPKQRPFFTMELEIEGDELVVEHDVDDPAPGEDDDIDVPAREVELSPASISFVMDDPEGESGSYVLSGVVSPNGTMTGTGLAPDQSTFSWNAERDADDDADEDADESETETARDTTDADLPPDDLGGAPFGPYAVARYPEQQTFLFRNATVWTAGPEGVIRNGWVLVQDGTIRGVGEGVPRALRGAVEIDCNGKHITPGIIDAHSHTGLFAFGVNESGQAVTSEVRIHDSLDPGDVNFYRQLASGVTTVNSLHGSANPIGGQNAIHKVRWGARHPGDMLMQDAMPGIKFALGENVKQSNWGDDFTTRYPQTRMGVETIIRDRFVAARAYAANGMKTDTGRTDLELEPLAQILAGERLIHCHSYRQDEILMLCRVAEEFGFTIGTFQHGLEVYKVAEAVREHALGASIFSDWWAFKVEVQDAIPYAGPVQHRAGVNTSFNSDSNELARRMNLEAAKAVKYSDGAVSPEEALKFVTINPAIQLGIADRVGSIEPGKDADLVVWSGDPLSTYSRVERTYVDGRELFTLEIDAAHRERIRAERQRLIQKIIAAPERAEDLAEEEEDARDTDPVGTDGRPTLLSRYYRALRNPNDMDLSQPGVCGCMWLWSDTEME